MQMIQNSAPIFMSKNSFLDTKPLKNETQEEKNLSNSSLKHDNTICSSQENEFLFFQKEEDSNNIFWPETDNAMNDISEESYNLLGFAEKSPNEKHLQSINQSNITYDENFSLDNKSLSLSQNKDSGYLNESNEIDFGRFNLNLFRLNDEEEKSGVSGDSFFSSFEMIPNQDVINFENDFNFKNLMEEGKNDSLDIINIKEPCIEEKEKNIKKEKINFMIKKEPICDNNNTNNSNISINLDNNNSKDLDGKKKSKFYKNDLLGKKRGDENKPKQISKNIKLNQFHDKNKVTIINSKAYKCECGKIFSTEENQRLHYINIHLHEKPYNCSFCGEGFSHRNGKIYHERVYHTFVFPYPCKECESAFASKSALIYHMKSKHKANS